MALKLNRSTHILRMLLKNDRLLHIEKLNLLSARKECRIIKECAPLIITQRNFTSSSDDDPAESFKNDLKNDRFSKFDSGQNLRYSFDRSPRYREDFDFEGPRRQGQRDDFDFDKPRTPRYRDDFDFDGQRRPRNRDDFDGQRRLRYRDDFGFDRPRRPRYRDDFDFDRQRRFGQRDRYRGDDRTSFGANLKRKEWNSKTLNSFEKNFFISHPSVTERSQEESDAFYKEHGISIINGEKPTPVFNFQEANFPEKINSHLAASGWSEPTPIQSIGWPLALSGKNVVGVAQTGSGKTLAFILPALVHIRHQRPVGKGESPIGIVLAPTRELAQQIAGVAEKYCKPLGIRLSCIFGGQSRYTQAKSLIYGRELLIATPGRLIDFLSEGVINLDRATFCVLDEADRMLDMGFGPQVRKILSQVRPDKQMMMWTATWPDGIQSLAQDFLGEDFTQINIGSTELTVNQNIKQIVRVCEEEDKFNLLLKDLESIRGDDKRLQKTLIFMNTQVRVDSLKEELMHHKIHSQTLHGRKSQAVRDSIFESFKNGSLRVLVATDVAARGLDVDDIKLVINYDIPHHFDNYIHRIGRTARAFKTGTAISYCTDDDAAQVPNLIDMLERVGQTVDPELEDLLSFHKKFYKKGSKKRHPKFKKRDKEPWLTERARNKRSGSWWD